MHGSRPMALKQAVVGETARIIGQDRFLDFRQIIRPGMIWDWWTEEVARHLQLFYREFMEGKRPKLALMAPPQHGKQVEDATPVLTTAGWKRHGDLRVGDLVFHPSGLPTRVVALSGKTPSDHRVELTNGEVVYCHGRHEWTVYNRNKKRWETIETQEMLRPGVRYGGWQGDRTSRHPLYTGIEGKRGCHYTYQLPLVSPLLGEEKELPVDPYVLGVWLGDGKSTAGLVTYARQDSVIVDAVRAQGFETGATHGNARYPNVLQTRFLGLQTQLRAAGVFADETGVRTKHIPEAYLTASLRQRLELLAGLIDTDGYIYDKNGRVVFVTGDADLARTFKHLLATFGWRHSTDTVAPTLSSSGIQGRKDCYYVGFQPTIPIPCRIPRKQIHVSAVRRRVAIRSITVEPDCGKVGNCITVDAPDGLYLVGETLQPTHNSLAMLDFVAWVAGKAPDKKVIFASYSDELGIRTNLDLQRIVSSERYRMIFPDTRISEKNVVTMADRWKRNSSHIEYVGHSGSFRNTTVAGQINGMELHLGVIDDPIKGRAEAHSKTVRDKTWDWFADDFSSRFAKDGAMLIVMTRWHVDDMLGRFIERNKDVKVLRYPAVAERDEPHRRKGQALFPAFKPLDFLMERRRMLTEASWESIYQQAPFVAGGGMFPVEKIATIPKVEVAKVQHSVRYFDKAACLIAGTMIATERGDVPIERVRVGDRVWTRSGLKPVKRAWLTKYTDRLTSVRFDNGSVVTGTPDHRIWTGDGWKPLANLDDAVYTGCLSIERRQSWKIEGCANTPSIHAGKCSGSTGSRISAIHSLLGRTIAAISSVAGSIFIGRCGARFTATFPTDATSITLTGTGTTTRQRILNASQGASITRCTAPRPPSSASCGNGIVRMERSSEQHLCESRSASRTMYANLAAILSALAATRPGFADAWRAVVKCISNVVDASTLGAFALIAGPVSFRRPAAFSVSNVQSEGGRENASGAAKDSPLGNRLRRRGFAAEAVAGSGSIPVYDLEVEDVHEFFANGILVHNSTGDDSAYTAGVLMHAMSDGTYVIGHVARGRWTALDREIEIERLARADDATWASYEVGVEQEPGSGGKESCEATIRRLAGLRVFGDRVTGKKEARAEPFAAQVQGGNVRIVGGEFVMNFLDEIEGFPSSKFKDQVDAASGAFARLVKRNAYDCSYSWL